MSFNREFTIRKSTDEVFDYSVEIIIQDPKATPYQWVSGVVSALDDADNITDRTAEILDVSRVSVSGNRVTFGVKAGVSGRSYIAKIQGIDASGQKRTAWGTIIVNNPV
jgi:hypothetical protein